VKAPETTVSALISKGGVIILQEAHARERTPHTFIKSVHGVRYQVKDVARTVALYARHLGFTVKPQQLSAFDNVSLGEAQILLSGPGASGSRPMPDGQQQASAGWNRLVLKGQIPQPSWPR
jgi:hypothetical protein